MINGITQSHNIVSELSLDDILQSTFFNPILQHYYSMSTVVSTTNALWNIWNEREAIKIQHTMYTLKGWSIAALRTNFYIPELDVMFDAGLSANVNPDYIMISHLHADHIANLPFHLYTTKTTRPKVYAPWESEQNIIDIIQGVQYNGQDGKEFYSFEKAIVGSKQVIEIKGKKFRLEIIECDQHANEKS